MTNKHQKHKERLWKEAHEGSFWRKKSSEMPRGAHFKVKASVSVLMFRFTLAS